MSAYTQTGPYMPDADGEFHAWLRNFAKKIHANPYRYGLSKGDADVIMNYWTSFDKAYATIQDPDTRTPSAIAHKDAIRASAKGSIRTYVGLLRTNLGLANDDLVSLGLHPRTTTRSPIPAPRSRPILMPICAFSGETYMRYADESMPASRRKPYGVVHLQVKLAVTQPGETPTRNPDDAHDVGFYTKPPILVPHDVKDAGKTGVFFGRWCTATGLTGPWSMPAYFTLTAGGSAAPEALLKEMHVPEQHALKRGQRRAA